MIPARGARHQSRTDILPAWPTLPSLASRKRRCRLLLTHPEGIIHNAQLTGQHSSGWIGKDRWFQDSPMGKIHSKLYGLSLSWDCFGLLPVLCSEQGRLFFALVACDQVPRARGRGQRTETLSAAWRIALLVFRSALRREHAEGGPTRAWPLLDRSRRPKGARRWAALRSTLLYTVGLVGFP